MGLFLAVVVIATWLASLAWLLLWAPFAWNSATTYVLMTVQAYLTTGLFITAHDAMHGTVSRHASINRIVGTLAALLYAGLWYPRLVRNHMAHHRHPAGVDDPDYHRSDSWLPWFLSFMRHYTTLPQLVFMAVAYNVLQQIVVPERLWAYWILPALLSTIQLITAGTYLPHRHAHTLAAPYHARSMRRAHVRAMLACWFFGYHHEHHTSPGTPWWQLWKAKEAAEKARVFTIVFRKDVS